MKHIQSGERQGGGGEGRGRGGDRVTCDEIYIYWTRTEMNTGQLLPETVWCFINVMNSSRLLGKSCKRCVVSNRI